MGSGQNNPSKKLQHNQNPWDQQILEYFCSTAGIKAAKKFWKLK